MSKNKTGPPGPGREKIRFYMYLLSVNFKKALYLVGHLIFIPLSYIIPKNSRYVVLCSRFGDFEGNLKYFFLYLNNLSESDYDFIFLTRKKKVYRRLRKSGYKVWFYPRFVTIIRLLLTDCLIVDGNEWANNFKSLFLNSSKKVQIWHGTGMKTIGLLKPKVKEMSRLRLKLRKEYTYYHLLSLSSEYQLKARGRAFRYGKLLINGLPRNDVFFSNSLLDNDRDSDRKTLEFYQDFKGKGFAIVTYTPTWRKFDNTIGRLDLKSMDELAAKYRFVFVVKMHYKHKTSDDLTGYKNIMEYENTADVYPLLGYTDLLITDYSSIYFDYLILDKPVVFYPYDKDEYSSMERELLLDYERITPGPKCYNQEQLEKEIINHLEKKQDKYSRQRNELRKQFFKYTDGKSSERLWKAIKEEILT